MATRLNVRLFFASVALAMAIQPAAAQKIDDVLKLVYETNPTIRAERARQDATQEAPKQARAALLPSASADTSYSRSNRDQIVNPDLFGTFVGEERSFDLNPLIGSVSAEQEVFAGFRNINRLRRARAIVKAGNARLRLTEQQVLLQSATAYFDVLRDIEIFDSNRSNVDVLSENLSHVKSRFGAGDATQTDIDQARARLAGARAALSASQARLSTSRARFERIVGQQPETLVANTEIPELPESEEEALAFAMEFAPQIQNAKEDEEASRRQISIEKSAFSPTISLNTRYAYAEEPNSFINRDEEFSYGVRASVPIFLGGLRLSKVREAKALNRSDKSRIIAVERQVRENVSASWNELFAAQMRITAAETQVAANEGALAGVRSQAQFGVRTILDILNAEQELLVSRVGLASARRDEFVAAYSLLAAMGAPLFEIREPNRAASENDNRARPSPLPSQANSKPQQSTTTMVTTDANTVDVLQTNVVAPSIKPSSKGVLESLGTATTPDRGDEQPDEESDEQQIDELVDEEAPQPITLQERSNPLGSSDKFEAQIGVYVTTALAQKRLDKVALQASPELQKALTNFGVIAKPTIINGAVFYRVRIGATTKQTASQICGYIADSHCTILKAR
ncbi:MAG: TolC family outer membrane protein [Pseudomonadota bacterium]